MSKKQASSSVSGSQIYDPDAGFGNLSVPVDQMSQRSASAPRLSRHDRGEVEGSKPRVWKPALAPKAPPGGMQDGKGDPRYGGRKQFPDMGAGNNRDPNAIESLRYYQDEERLGKIAGPKMQPETNKHSRDSHRYYLAAEGKPEITPGRMRRPSDPTGKSMPGFEFDRPAPASQSTSAGGSGDDVPVSDCDSLPLGAEWSFHAEGARG